MGFIADYRKYFGKVFIYDGGVSGFRDSLYIIGLFRGIKEGDKRYRVCYTDYCGGQSPNNTVWNKLIMTSIIL
jgi:hypothetical protein